MDARRFRLPIAGVAALTGMLGSISLSGQPQTTFTNSTMNRIFHLYGAPDEKTSTAGAEIWRYRSVKDFHGASAEFQFQFGGRRPGMSINSPLPVATVHSVARLDPSAVGIVEALDQSEQRTDHWMALSPSARQGQSLFMPNAPLAPKPNAPAPIAGFPGGQATIQIYPGSPNILLSVPVDLSSAPFEIVGRFMEVMNAGQWEQEAESFHPSAIGMGGTYQIFTVLAPGSYVCRLILREKSSGQLYTEEIPFEVKK